MEKKAQTELGARRLGPRAFRSDVGQDSWVTIATSASEVKMAMFLSMKDAFGHASFTQIRVRRAPEYDKGLQIDGKEMVKDQFYELSQVLANECK